MENLPLPAESPYLRILNLARKLEADIKARKLKAGDFYLTTVECARLLGANTSAINKALQLLSTRHILRRGRRVGTIITGPPKDLPASPISMIHLIIDPSAAPHPMAMDDILIGIQSVFPTAILDVKILPKSGELVFLKRLVQGATHGNEVEAILLISASAILQHLCAESGLPVLAIGLPHCAVKNLPYADWDARAGGEALTADLLKHHPKSLMILTREHLFPRDHAFLDGVFRAAGSRDFAAAQISFRSLENDELSVRAEVASFLNDRPGPHAIIVTAGEQAVFADSVMRLRFRAKPQLIGIADCHFEHSIIERYPRLRFDCTTRQVGEMIGAHLRLIVDSPPGPVPSCRIPFKLVAPGKQTS